MASHEECWGMVGSLCDSLQDDPDPDQRCHELTWINSTILYSLLHIPLTDCCDFLRVAVYVLVLLISCSNISVVQRKETADCIQRSPPAPTAQRLDERLAFSPHSMKEHQAPKWAYVICPWWRFKPLCRHDSGSMQAASERSTTVIRCLCC